MNKSCQRLESKKSGEFRCSKNLVSISVQASYVEITLRPWGNDCRLSFPRVTKLPSCKIDDDTRREDGNIQFGGQTRDVHTQINNRKELKFDKERGKIKGRVTFTI